MSTAGEFIHVSLWLRQNIYDEIKEKIKDTSFDGVGDYIVKLLEREVPSTLVFTEEEEKIINEKLRRLGYIE